jgi:hypothetical protein
MAGVEYSAIPRATAAPFMPTVVALAAGAAKTALQVATPATTDLVVIGWGVSFDGASGTAVPVICQLVETDVGASGLTSLTPELWGNALQSVSLCVGGAAATGHGGGVTPTEGTITTVRQFDAQHVHPQAGYGIWFTEGVRPRVSPSRFLRVRCQAPAAVNVIPWVVWAEPAV